MLLHLTNENGVSKFLDKPTESHENEVFSRMKQDASITEFQFLHCPGIDGEKVRYRRVTEIEAHEIREREEEKRMRFTERIHALHDRQAEAKRNAIRKLIDELIQATSESVKAELIEEIRRKTIDLHDFGEEM